MIAVVEDLDGLAIWEHAERYYAPVREEPRLAPPEGREFVPQQNDGSFCKVRADYTSGDYCSIFIVWVPWGEETQKLLLRLRKHIPASIADELLKTFERFRDRA